MGVFIFLVIVTIVIIVGVKLRKRAKAFEDLENCQARDLALTIKDELEKKGYSTLIHDPFYIAGQAEGSIGVWNSDYDGRISFCAYRGGSGALYYEENSIKSMQAVKGGHIHAIKNNNIGIIVSSTKESQEEPPFIKIAAEIINNSGYGESTWIE